MIFFSFEEVGGRGRLLDFLIPNLFSPSSHQVPKMFSTCSSSCISITYHMHKSCVLIHTPNVFIIMFQNNLILSHMFCSPLSS
jgi:hypothetical protein